MSVPHVPVVTGEHFHRHAGLEHLSVPEQIVAKFWPQGVARFPIGAAVDSPAVEAFVDCNRWLVRCPFCAVGVQHASEADPRFFCVNCLNLQADGCWLTVVWPDERSLIEDALTVRPVLDQRNWLPGESVADLTAQNDSLGVE